MRTLGLALVATASAVAAQPQPDYIAADHAAALNEYLADEPCFAVPVEGDFDGLGWFRSETDRGADFHPYYAVGRLDVGATEDFAVLLLGRPQHEVGAWGSRGAYEARVVLFHRLGDGGFQPTVAFEAALPIATLLDYEESGRVLTIGVSETDFGYQIARDGRVDVRDAGPSGDG